MRRIKHQNIRAGFDQLVHPVHKIAGNADCRTRQQTAADVARRMRVADSLLDILNGNQAPQAEFIVHDRQLFNLVFPQDLLCALEVGADRGSHQILFGHDLFDRDAVVLQKTQVTVGQDADQLAVLAADRHT